MSASLPPLSIENVSQEIISAQKLDDCLVKRFLSVCDRNDVDKK